MVILITGASHSGKTLLAQRMLEKYNYPYLSIDHLKMGLIRSGFTDLTPLSTDEELTSLLWPVVSEMIKTAIENGQNLIVEGCYVPFDWKDSFGEEYLRHIDYRLLIMSEEYIRKHFDDIKGFENVIEKRICDDFCIEDAICDNKKLLANAEKYRLPYTLIDGKFEIKI
ncbi:MAG: adenylate kinase [Clostridia bacterium]|nr:adenylate kinase [Clostridia bacterium]